MTSAVTPSGIRAAIEVLGRKPGQAIPDYLTLVLKATESIHAYETGTGELQYGKNPKFFKRNWAFILTQKRLVLANAPNYRDADGQGLGIYEINAVKVEGLFNRKVHVHHRHGLMKLTIDLPGDVDRFSGQILQIRFGTPSDNIPNLRWYSRDAIPGKAQISARQAIPRSVQRLVWERDNERCVECGSTSNLQFDHIIPVSRGGSNSAENIQILCQACNLRKSNRIGG